MKFRSSSELFTDLINLNADEWNIKLAKELKMTIEQMKSLFVLKDKLNMTEDRVKLVLYKKDIRKSGEVQKEVDEQTKRNINNIQIENPERQLEIPTKLDKYTIRVKDDETVIESMSCTGKIIVGLDFSNSELDNSFFSHCTFYNCDFSEVDFTDSAFQTCVFNSCYFTKTELTNSVFSRCTFLDCPADYSIWQYTVFTDTTFIACQLNFSDFNSASFLNGGLCDCSAINSDWKDFVFTSTSMTSIELNDTNLHRAKFRDVMLVRVNLLGCDLDYITVTSLTATICKYDSKYEDLFQLNHFIFSPAIVEWEKIDDEDDETEAD